MFDKILIANRGEIACRIIRTAKRLGIKTVAIYSDADVHALHVQQADEAYCVGPAPSRDSYLQMDKIIAIAQKSGVQAIHPGYGFLSENTRFAAACLDAGLVFIGPPASAIEAMGSKSAAKRLMQQANIPLVPGYHQPDQNPQLLAKAAAEIGYPVLLKAVAGGGGKGMRTVWQAEEFMAALESAKREAASSFGDDTMLVEKYLTKPRHIEIQVFLDSFGNGVYLFERDCSIQRRHQKVIEEAPATHFPATTREQMGNAAVAAARAINYLGAGTIEFLLDEDGQFYFMEMNTRLQVEHPITEMITRQDLVEWQLRVAAGEPLPCQQEQLSIHGHAIEVRIYAEDPQNHFLPATGTIEYLHTPTESNHVRIDSGVTNHSIISPYYDPMIAKLIIWDEDREAALRRLQLALQQYHIVGLQTNLAFLEAVVHHPAFIAADIDTGFINKHQTELLPAVTHVTEKTLVLSTLYLLLQQASAAKNSATISSDPYSPWHQRDSWQSNLPSQQTLRLVAQDKEFVINAQTLPATTTNATTYKLTIANAKQHYTVSGILEKNNLHAHIDDEQLQIAVMQTQDDLYLFGAQLQSHLKIYNPTIVYELQADNKGRLNAPMPGTVVAVMANTGQNVKSGDNLLIIEAMKMEHTIQAPHDGVVKAIHFQVGDLVDEGVELLSIESSI